MIAHVQATSSLDLIAKIEGEKIAKGSAGTNTLGSPNFQDLTSGAFADVLAGDRVWISGISTPFVVQTVTNANNIVFTTNIGVAHTTNAKWRAKRGGIGDPSDLLWDPVFDGAKWHLFYDQETFGV